MKYLLIHKGARDEKLVLYIGQNTKGEQSWDRYTQEEDGCLFKLKGRQSGHVPHLLDGEVNSGLGEKQRVERVRRRVLRDPATCLIQSRLKIWHAPCTNPSRAYLWIFPRATCTRMASYISPMQNGLFKLSKQHSG